jgi:hypothetical protein
MSRTHAWCGAVLTTVAATGRHTADCCATASSPPPPPARTCALVSMWDSSSAASASSRKGSALCGVSSARADASARAQPPPPAGADTRHTRQPLALTAGLLCSRRLRGPCCPVLQRPAHAAGPRQRASPHQSHAGCLPGRPVGGVVDGVCLRCVCVRVAQSVGRLCPAWCAELCAERGSLSKLTSCMSPSSSPSPSRARASSHSSTSARHLAAR